MAGDGWAVVAASLVLAGLLAAITIVDFRRMVIPNGLNLALGLSGACFLLIARPDNLPEHLLAAAGFGLLFWLLREAHSRLRSATGLGMGDVKMAAAAAVWVNPLLLPVLLFVASASALVFAGLRLAGTGPSNMGTRIPFGPFLAIGLASVWTLENFVFWSGDPIGW
ncbi:A24 family peptidase [Mesorhizobium sp. CC13]|uniref:A24 family peptidase n=1 Tax=Mesorhizobium sp. CC13 TaxID=3029194 RepID=UPI0032648C82